jgi:hypothetical protein
MSSHPTDASSPSNSLKPAGTCATLEASRINTSSTAPSDFAESPQPIAEQTTSTSISTSTSTSTSTSIPAIVITDSHTLGTSTTELNQQSQCPVSDNTPSSQPGHPQLSSNPSSSTTTSTMSSASSSPGNTSTAGASSGSSNPSYQLPYAPFPYPMPANGRGSGQQSGSSK